MTDSSVFDRMAFRSFGRDDIARRIPHAGTMCLLERVLEVDAARIVCGADSHRRPDGNVMTD